MGYLFKVDHMDTIKKIYALYTQSYHVSTDTRAIEKNCIFFALKGANFNGNQFAKQALEKGALAAVVDEAKYASSEHTILVNDVLTTLQEVAHYHRTKLGIPIISLTGSNGKTTTKELMTRVLSTTYQTQATKGNLNNHIGVPLTLLSILPIHEMAVVEMGANHQKEIEQLCRIAEPDYGYITNFGKAHLEGFGGVEGVIKGKTELYQYLQKEKKNVFINEDDPIQLEKSQGIESFSFGRTKGDVLVEEIDNDSPFVSVRYQGMEIKSHLIGNYNFSNIASAIALGHYFKIEKEKIQKAIEHYIPENNRSQLIEKQGKQILLDAYNANPSSMSVALENFSKLPGMKTVILGDMFELGEYAEKEHQHIANFALEKQFDQILLVGNHFNNCQNNLTSFTSTQDLIEYLKKNEVNEKILIKGSRGMKLETILDYL